MPTETGIFTQEDLTGHLFSYQLARFIKNYFPPETPIIDVGCGLGTYMQYLNDVGHDCYGIEGTDGISNVYQQDLTKTFEYPIKGNVICLEVAEHIPAEFEHIFLDNLTRIVKPNGYLIISWAVEGQEGTGHVNCKNNDYVIERICKEGFDYLETDSMEIRKVIENHYAYFRDTLLIFRKWIH